MLGRAKDGRVQMMLTHLDRVLRVHLDRLVQRDRAKTSTSGERSRTGRLLDRLLILLGRRLLLRL
jgi:hypothetical protein